MGEALIAVSGLIEMASRLPGFLFWAVTVAIALGLVIFVHELGHFLAAKACGVKVEKFYIGFDVPMKFLPASLFKFNWGETEYGIGILPLGGYVKMLGQDDNPKNQAIENERIKIRKTDTAESGEPAPQDTDEFVWDPRSYPAKPVWQRMIIISAGVVMNLIFAVIFAFIAYSQGVSYMPCVLGGASPGDPAWVAGLQGGDQILQIGRRGTPDEQLRFDKDLMIDVTLNGAKRPLNLLIRRAGESEPTWFSITPTDRLAGIDRPATLGVRPATTTVIAGVQTTGTAQATDPGYQALQPGDEIVRVDGTPLARSPATGYIYEHELDRLLAPRMADPVTLTVQRPAAVDAADATVRTFDVTLPPTPLRTTGIVVEPGPVVAVRQHSPAEQAGFREGDILVTMNGTDVGDPLTLRQRLLSLVGQSVEWGVRRTGQADLVLLTATPETPTAFQDGFSPCSPLGLESLGLAFHLSNTVKDVLPDTPAAKAGLQTGDTLLTAAFVKDGAHDGEPLDLTKFNWYFAETLVNVVPDAQLELTYRRGGDHERTATIGTVASDQFFVPARRLQMKPLTRTRTAGSWSEAWALGYTETSVSVKKVFAVLERLFTGRLSYRSLGGPIMIVRAAGSEASEGLPRLLVFLTFLSANLAVLNFLPIPALDGGHMLFLIAEGIRGKPLNERLQVTLTLIGVGCLLSLMVLVFTLDIRRFF